LYLFGGKHEESLEVSRTQEPIPHGLHSTGYGRTKPDMQTN